MILVWYLFVDGAKIILLGYFASKIIPDMGYLTFIKYLSYGKNWQRIAKIL